jgi:glycosyltransferase involved in cell wall biosynthesis
MPLTIAHVLSSFGMGGQERVALDLAIGQRAAGHRALAISLESGGEGPLAADFRAHGVEVIHLPKRPGFDVRMPFSLGALFRREGVSVVHTHNPQPLIYGSLAAKAAGAALVHTKHGVNPGRGRRLWARRAASRLVDAFVAVSAPTADVARAAAECPPRALRVIPNGIDLGRFGPDAAARAAIRSELGVDDRAFVAGTVGRLYPEKGHDYLIRAVTPLCADDFHVVIAGDGPERERLRAQVDALPRATSVHLLGARRDVPRLLAALDVFVLSSVREGLPLVIPEAMAAGLPVLSTAVGGIPQVVDEGATGFLVDHGDEAALRDRLARLRSDRALARRMGTRGREVALERYSSQRMVRDYLSLYEEIIR